ncbi:DUF2029 domain-containing protein [Streptacidiphilus sp. 4-A2]|nr:DUF2029 domain-containing protein [Streptacidiphilus sp. 4-A2]
MPLGVAAGSALLHCLLLLWLDNPTESFASRFHVWDASFYVEIAQSGYPHGYTYANGALTGNNLAFFPLYPLLIRVLHTVTGLDWGTAAVTVSWLCAFAAAVVVHRLVRSLASARVAGFAVALVFCQPMAVSLWIAYTESLFLLLSAAALLAMRRESWLWAGLLCCCAGLTRSTGIAVSAALVVAVLLAARRERRLSLRMLAGGFLGCVGMPGYLLWVGLRGAAERLGAHPVGGLGHGLGLGQQHRRLHRLDPAQRRRLGAGERGVRADRLRGRLRGGAAGAALAAAGGVRGADPGGVAGAEQLLPLEAALLCRCCWRCCRRRMRWPGRGARRGCWRWP